MSEKTSLIRRCDRCGVATEVCWTNTQSDRLALEEQGSTVEDATQEQVARLKAFCFGECTCKNPPPTLFNMPVPTAPPRKPTHKPTPLQQAIATAIQHRGGTAKKSDLMSEPFAKYYCGADRHFGAALSRMVKQGFIERVKPGVYRLKGGEG